MLPLLILVVPPTLAGGGYLSWSAGRDIIIRTEGLSNPPTETFASYGSGLITLAGTYGMAEFALGKSGGTGEQSLQHANASKKFVPPKSVSDLLGRIGPPVLMRLGAASLAFFCAGAVQTYVASVGKCADHRNESVGR